MTKPRWRPKTLTMSKEQQRKLWTFSMPLRMLVTSANCCDVRVYSLDVPERPWRPRNYVIHLNSCDVFEQPWRRIERQRHHHHRYINLTTVIILVTSSSFSSNVVISSESLLTSRSCKETHRSVSSGRLWWRRLATGDSSSSSPSQRFEFDDFLPVVFKMFHCIGYFYCYKLSIYRGNAVLCIFTLYNRMYVCMYVYVHVRVCECMYLFVCLCMCVCTMRRFECTIVWLWPLECAIGQGHTHFDL